MGYQVELEEPIGSLIAVINRHDSQAFLDAFAENGSVDDWGRTFTGRQEIEQWSEREFIGALGTLNVETVSYGDQQVTVVGDWRSHHANGRSRFLFDLTGDKIAKMTIREG